MSAIYIRQADNDKYFNQKLPTFRNGFCYIERKVAITPDPREVWEFYGFIKTPNGRAAVTSIDGKEWEIE